ncbi:hypothetical protein SLE2022_099950 [Rubroshorea leprosula]
MFESGQGDAFLLRYNRAKLLDLYQKTYMRAYQKLLDGLVSVPSLTQNEPQEPLGLFTPNSEEMIVLKGIERGDITSSGAAQLSKDGSYDPNHEFIEKFLNYKELLSADVLELAFQSRNGQNTRLGAGDVISDNTGAGDYERDILDGSSKGGGKKKGKKGKKVSLSSLGFNVVSNRIMMGEIQTVDD